MHPTFHRNAEPLPYNEFDRERDRLMGRLIKGEIGQREFNELARQIDAAEDRACEIKRHGAAR